MRRVGVPVPMSSDSHLELSQTNVDVETLRSSLKNVNLQKDRRLYREVVKSVVATMTLGFDVSSLFSEMVMACATTDLVQKKLVYFYLCAHAESQSELALLTVSTLCTDAVSSNAMVRGLALRSMFNLRLPGLVVHMKDPLMKALQDRSAYVRKTAVVACLKLYHVSRETFEELDLLPRLRKCIYDDDPKVAVNSLLCVDEILSPEGGLSPDSNLVHHLLPRMIHFETWDQALVMAWLSRYRPKQQDEMFEVLNIIDCHLRSTNSGIVLAAAKVFIVFAQGEFAEGELKGHIFQRLKVPLVSITTTQPPEIIFTALQHLDFMVGLEPELFCDAISSFFVRDSDPLYVKEKRLEILTQLVTDATVDVVLAELRASGNDLRSGLCLSAIRGIGTIAKRTHFFDKALPVLLELMGLENGPACAEVMVLFKEILLLDGSKSGVILGNLSIPWDVLDSSPLGKAAAIWIVANFHKELPGGAYVLEGFIDTVADEDEVVKKHLLLATVTLFWAYPAVMQKMLGKLLRYCIEDCSDMDVRDRALLYYRLLKTDVDMAKRVICSGGGLGLLSLELPKDTRRDDLSCFNSMAMFGDVIPVPRSAPLADGTSTHHAGGGDTSVARGTEERRCSVVEVGDLLGSEVSEPRVRHALALFDSVSLDAPQFEHEWQTTRPSLVFDQHLTVCPTSVELLPYLKSRNVHLMASGRQEETRDCYFLYCKEVSRTALVLVQLVIDQVTCTSHVTLKSRREDVLGEFVTFFKTLFVGKWIAVDSEQHSPVI